MNAPARVLAIAGSDSGGGAGLQADIKTITMLGGYAMTAVTAVTAQDTTGVHAVEGLPPALVRRQIEVVLGDLGADAIKTGMLHSAPVIGAVAEALEAAGALPPLVIDPVMVASSGARLLQEDAEAALVDRLLPLAFAVTPNVHEAGVLAGLEVRGPEEMQAAGERILAMGPGCVLVTGGDLPGDLAVDVLVTGAEIRTFTSPRIATRATHGTGCTLASALATGLAQGLDLVTAVERARAYVQGAIAHAPGLGRGHGPLDHGWLLHTDDEPEDGA